MNLKNQTNHNLNHVRILDIVKNPHMSEKATNGAEKNHHFVFKVASFATKIEIKQAIEMLFGVKVKNVRVCNVKSKERRFKQTTGLRKGWKKAYVALREGQDINFVGTK